MLVNGTNSFSIQLTRMLKVHSSDVILLKGLISMYVEGPDCI